MNEQIPSPMIAALSQVVPDCETHATLNALFMHAGAPGEPPEGSKPVKVQEWLRRTNRESSNPLAVLGRLIEDYMEADTGPLEAAGVRNEARIRRLSRALSQSSLTYVRGGTVTRGLGSVSKSLEELIRDRNIPALNEEFDRAERNVESSPREAVSAACNALESVCKVYIEDEQLESPRKPDLSGVWGVVRKHLGLDPSKLADNDLKQIVSGLLGVVSGIGAFRTHASSAHGHGRGMYRLEPRHARLAIHAAHTVVVFVLESWDDEESGRRFAGSSRCWRYYLGLGAESSGRRSSRKDQNRGGQVYAGDA